MPILKPGEAIRHPHAQARGMHVALQVGEGSVEQIGTPFHLSANPPVAHRPAPLPGADNLEILASLGFDADRVQALTDAGVFSSERGARE